MKQMWRTCVLAVLCLAGCGDDDGANGAPDSGVEADAADTPDASSLGLPITAAEVEAMIAAGDYLDWVCEAAPRAMRGPSPHGAVRVCSNRVLSTYVQETDDWLRGSAAMKELYASATDTDPIGYSYYVKVDDESAQGTGWYWYERRASGVTADGRGEGADGSAGCIACHAVAGSDAAHTAGVGSRDFVYTAITR